MPIGEHTCVSDHESMSAHMQSLALNWVRMCKYMGARTKASFCTTPCLCAACGEPASSAARWLTSRHRSEGSPVRQPSWALRRKAATAMTCRCHQAHRSEDSPAHRVARRPGSAAAGAGRPRRRDSHQKSRRTHPAATSACAAACPRCTDGG